MYLGLDVGGTNLKAARIETDGSVAEHRHSPVARRSVTELLDQLEASIRDLLTGDVVAVGVGVPGILDRTGRVRVSPNLPILHGQSLADELHRRVRLPVFLENDANAAALAEAWLGAGGGCQDLMLVTLGTGVGGGLVLGGRIWDGCGGYAGEIGHIQVEPSGEPCGCGSRGCIETIAGAAAWARLAERALASGRGSLLEGGAVDPKVVALAAQAGDAVALEVVDEVARALGVGIAATLLLLNLEKVVIGGGISRAGRVLLEAIARHVRQRLFPELFDPAMIQPASLGTDAGVIGAARVAMLGTGMPA